MSDPDNLPLTDEGVVPHTKNLRRVLRLSLEEFATQFRIPIATLLDWEEGRSEPDQVLRAYLKVIATAPDVVRKSLTQNS